MNAEMKALLADYGALWTKLGFAKPKWPLETAPGHAGGHHAEFAEGSYRWIASERGAYLDLRETKERGEILRWIAVDVTYALAHGEIWQSGEVKGTEAEKRRKTFLRNVELLRLIDEDWADARRAQLEKSKAL